MSLVALPGFFIIGAVFASFAGVVAARLNTGSSVLRGRSRCDACGKELSVLSLVPILSYLASRGKAQCCGAKISPRSTLGEVLLGALFALAYLHLGTTLALVPFLLALVCLYTLVLYDLAHTVLPPILLVPFVAFALVYAVLVTPSAQAAISSGVTACAIAAFLLALNLLSGGRAMGIADAPLAFGLSVLAAPLALSGFVMSFWVGAVVGIIILAKAPTGSRMGIEVPFAPFLACGFLLAYFTQWDPFALIASLAHLA